MLRVFGHPTSACDGITRRDLLRAGSIAALTGGFPLTGKAGTTALRPKAKAVILLDLFGGPSHIDTFDPKPNAPDGIRGEFGTIATALAGVRKLQTINSLTTCPCTSVKRKSRPA